MNDHPDLVALLRGEPSNADVTEVGDHLDSCDECRRGSAFDRALVHFMQAVAWSSSRQLRPSRHQIGPSGLVVG